MLHDSAARSRRSCAARASAPPSPEVPPLDRLAAAAAAAGERPLGLLLARRHHRDLLALLADLLVDRGLGAGRLLLGLAEQVASSRSSLAATDCQRGGPVQEAVGGVAVEQRGHRAEPAGPVRHAGELADASRLRVTSSALGLA